MKQVFTTSILRSFLTFLSFSISVHAIAQPKLSDELPLNAYYLGIDGRSTVLKTTVDSLITLHNNSRISDTERVKIIFQLGGYECVRCVEFLLDNLTRDYYWGGDNYSYEDIARKTAAFSALNKIAIDPDRGWYLFPHLLYSLKKQKRNEPPLYYLRLYYLLSCFSSNSEIMKLIIDKEIIKEYKKERIPFTTPIYIENLNLMLKTYEEDRK